MDNKFLYDNKHLASLNLPWDKIKEIMASETHPFSERTDDPIKDLLRVIRNPKNFYFTCRYILNVKLGPFQDLILQEMWESPFPILIATRGGSKSTLLAIYALLRALLCQGCKVALIGAVFRQSKVIFENAEKIWNNAPILRDLVAGGVKVGVSKDNDRWNLFIGDSIISAFPMGDGSKIRGQRAHYLIIDEFATLNAQVFEHVIRGFAIVSANPIEGMDKAAEIQLLKDIGMWSESNDVRTKNFKGNQTILAGTAYYSFNHFYKYYMEYKTFIQSKGDVNLIKHLLGRDVDEDFNWQDYKIIRLPIELLPKGYMSPQQVSAAKMSMSEANQLMELYACFTADSEGFFKRSLIEHCTTLFPIDTLDGPAQFRSVLRGNSDKQYVFGIDPASEKDNFSIVVLEVHKNHARIVHCWVTNDKKHKELIKLGRVKEHDFYRYAARKIRDLMLVFPCAHIALDAQGGGKAISEALADPENLSNGEQPIYPVTEDHPLWDKVERDTDDKQGMHILELVQFSRAEWTADANHNMKKDFETQQLLFPLFDPIELGLAAEKDSMKGNVYDTLEECVQDIEELKEELSTIQISQTPSGREKWDTPEVKTEGDKKGRLRKDRYSALLMANAAARKLRTIEAPRAYTYVGGFSNKITKTKSTDLYVGPAWFVNHESGYNRR